MKYRIAAMASLILGVIVVGKIYTSHSGFEKANMTEASPRVASLFEKTKTVCFGRFIMEVPISATIVHGADQVPYTTQRYPGKAGDLQKMVADEESKAKAKTAWPPGRNFSYYKETVAGVLPGQKIVVSINDDEDYYKFSSYFRLNDDIYTQNDETVIDNPEKYNYPSLPEVIARLNKAAQAIKPHVDDSVPSEVGVCIDGGLVLGGLDEKFEKIFLGVRLKEFPDVHFSIETHKTEFPADESSSIEGLLGRSLENKDPGAVKWFRTLKYLRRAPREIMGLPGYELLLHIPKSDDEADGFKFHFLYQGEPKNSLKPEIDARLDTGVVDNTSLSVPSSLSEAEVVAVWDKLLGSIRLRPTKVSTATTGADLGTLAASGRVCPQTGWWRCIEASRPVQGGRRQFFRHGERMPEIALLGDRSLWQRVSGEQPVHRMSTVWELVAYEGSPDGAAGPGPGPTKS